MSGDNIMVAIKSRPFITREETEKMKRQWNIQEAAIFPIDDEGVRIGEPFSFDHIFSEHKTNKDVYDAVVAPLVESCLEGFNSTIFAYGQTSSGKTHTMMGAENTPGIMQLAVTDIFDQVKRHKCRRYLISCSYFELYNEKIYDLLEKNGGDMKIHEDCYGNTFVKAKADVVTLPSEVFGLMEKGNKIRKIGCTNMNERSSRSHTIFRFTIESTENHLENGPVQHCQLNLVDLAGSERVAHTKAAGERLKEGVNINKSLSALANVIRQLSESERYINYRDSKLTRLLQHALGGNAKSLIIATITLAASEETKSTLEFAQRAKVIKNKPKINEIVMQQEKSKQYKLLAAGYKKRILDMEREKEAFQREKEEREMEISKLKQQVQLIDIFTKGPETKVESKLPRRHTVGHYDFRIPLASIPESDVLPSTPMKFQDDFKKPLDDEELFSKIASQSDEDFVKMLIEESVEDCLRTTTPEPSEGDTSSQSNGTPSSVLRGRLKYTEESYMSLQEFTKLETEYKEKDKDIVQQLMTEKDNLLKDLIDLNIIIKEERYEKEQLKVHFEDAVTSLKNKLEYQTKKATEFAFALEQITGEKRNLIITNEQKTKDHQFLMEQQKFNFEKQMEFMTKEIERLNSLQAKEEPQIYILEKIKTLEEDNQQLRETSELLKTKYEDQLAQYEEITCEKRNLIITNEQKTKDHQFLMEQQKFNFEKQMEFMTKEIERLNSLQAKEETQIYIQEKIKTLEEDNQQLRETSELLKTKYEDQLAQYEEITCEKRNLIITNEQKTKEHQFLMEQQKFNFEKQMEFMTKEIGRLNSLQAKEETQIYIQEKIKTLEEDNQQLRETSELLKTKYEDQLAQYEELTGEKRNLIITNEQKTKEYQFLMEQQKINFEKQMEFMTKEIERLNTLQANDEPQIYIQEKIKTLEEDNQQLRETSELLKTKYENQLAQYEELTGEKRNLIITNKQKTKEHQFLIEQQKINFEKQMEFMTKEIERLNTLQAKDEPQIYIQEKIKTLEEDNQQLRETSELLKTKYENQLAQFEELTGEKRNLIITNEKKTKEHQFLMEQQKFNFEKQMEFMTKEIERLNSLQAKDEPQIYIQEKIKTLEEDNQRLRETSELLKTKYEEQLAQYEADLNQLNTKQRKLEDCNILSVSTQTEIEKGTPKLHEEEMHATNEIIKNLQGKIADYEKEIAKFENIEFLKSKLQDEFDEYKNNEERRINEINSALEEELNKNIKNSQELDTYKELIQKLEGKIVETESELCKMKCYMDSKRSECSDKNDQIQRMEKNISSLNEERIATLNKFTCEIEAEKLNNRYLEEKLDHLQLENIAMTDKIKDLEYSIGNLKSKIPYSPIEKALPAGSSNESPKEIRRKKRQSIHDQRRGLDTSGAGTSSFGDTSEEYGLEKGKGMQDLKDEIEKLNAKVVELTNENNFLEFEVQGFMGVLDDCKGYNKEYEMEIDMLKIELKKAQERDCKNCEGMKTHVKQLEQLQQENNCKIVNLQTKIYDLKNTYEFEKNRQHDNNQLMQYKIDVLEKKLGEEQQLETKTTGTQCDMYNYNDLLEKYTNTKQVARWRRKENHILRAKLGLTPDDPIP